MVLRQLVQLRDFTAAEIDAQVFAFDPGSAPRQPPQGLSNTRDAAFGYDDIGQTTAGAAGHGIDAGRDRICAALDRALTGTKLFTGSYGRSR